MSTNKKRMVYEPGDTWTNEWPAVLLYDSCLVSTQTDTWHPALADQPRAMVGDIGIIISLEDTTKNPNSSDYHYSYMLLITAWDVGWATIFLNRSGDGSR